jgi:hypothetical protein
MPSRSKTQGATYPWAELYDLESRRKDNRDNIGMPRRQGRPNRLYPRHGTMVMLSDEEMAIFDELHYRIRSALRPATVTKGQVHGLALRLLFGKAARLPEHAESWETLVAMIFNDEE